MADEQTPVNPTPQAQEDKPSTNAILSLALGIGGFFICQPVGVVALFLAMKERKAIEQGTSPKAGETFALIGLILGIINTVITVFWLLFAIFWVIAIIIGAASGGFSS